MKNKLNTCKKGCKTCNDDAKDMQNQLQNRDPKELNFPEKGCKTCNDDAKSMKNQLQNKDPKELSFEEAKQIFFPLKEKINSKK